MDARGEEAPEIGGAGKSWTVSSVFFLAPVCDYVLT